MCDDPAFYSCDDGRCIPVSFKCDRKFDCGPGDFSDEKDCNGELVDKRL